MSGLRPRNKPSIAKNPEVEAANVSSVKFSKVKVQDADMNSEQSSQDSRTHSDQEGLLQPVAQREA